MRPQPVADLPNAPLTSIRIFDEPTDDTADIKRRTEDNTLFGRIILGWQRNISSSLPPAAGSKDQRILPRARFSLHAQVMLHDARRQKQAPDVNALEANYWRPAVFPLIFTV